MDDRIFIQHKFAISRDGYDYSDAIILPQEEYAALTEEQIESIKEERFQTWLAIIMNPPPDSNPQGSEEIQQTMENIEQQIEILTSQKEQLQVKKEEVVAMEIAVGIKDIAEDKVLVEKIDVGVDVGVGDVKVDEGGV